jgi:hypothetical protein
MKIGDFAFNLRELAGSMGDFGTLFPLAIGYIVVCGLDPAGFLVMMGLANIITGLVYRLPMPIEPMKVLAVMAIAQHWSPSMVYASAFSMGIIWLILSLSGIVGIIAKITPQCVVRGIQISLGVLLASKALEMISSWWLLGLVSVIIIIVLRNSRYAPGAIVLMALGLIIMYVKGTLGDVGFSGLQLPSITVFRLPEIWNTLVLAGFAQIPLTAANAVIATAALITSYWPDKPVSEQKLSFNMGVMNLVTPFFGGMPMCHGAGGLAGQYYFGARTGGTNIIEGTIEILLGLFLAGSIVSLFMGFPIAIVGAMMFLVGLELMKFAKDVRMNFELIPLAVTVAGSLAANMAWGFILGICSFYILKRWKKV